MKRAYDAGVTALAWSAAGATWASALTSIPPTLAFAHLVARPTAAVLRGARR